LIEARDQLVSLGGRTKLLTCTAAVITTAVAPPAAAWHLTIIAKTKQKAAN